MRMLRSVRMPPRYGSATGAAGVSALSRPRLRTHHRAKRTIRGDRPRSRHHEPVDAPQLIVRPVRTADRTRERRSVRHHGPRPATNGSPASARLGEPRGARPMRETGIPVASVVLVLCASGSGATLRVRHDERGRPGVSDQDVERPNVFVDRAAGNAGRLERAGGSAGADDVTSGPVIRR